MRQLESQLAENSRSESARIRVLQEECERLRRALLATRKRILGLTTAISGVSDNIGIALGLEGDSAAGCHSAGVTRDATPDTPAVMLEESATCPPMEAQVIEEKAAVEPAVEGMHQTDLVPTMPSANEINSQPTVQSLSWPIDIGLSLDFDMGSSSSWTWHSGEVGQNEVDSNNYNVLSASPDPSRVLQRTDYQKVVPYFESSHFNGSRLGEACITTEIRVTFPPGNTTFPSNFSGHLAACEFFIKQNKAYKQRGQPGGSKA